MVAFFSQNKEKVACGCKPVPWTHSRGAYQVMQSIRLLNFLGYLEVMIFEL